MRTLTVTQKISGLQTGLRGSLFVHVDHTAAGRIIRIRVSDKAKDGCGLDVILTAVSDALTDCATEAQNGRQGK